MILFTDVIHYLVKGLHRNVTELSRIGINYAVICYGHMQNKTNRLVFQEWRSFHIFLNENENKIKLHYNIHKMTKL